MTNRQLKATLLGCGSSGGVPRIGNDWGVCDPNNPKNRRSRCGLHVAISGIEGEPPVSILIDTAPDLREQLIRNEISDVDCVLFTHDHADQTHGIDDIRVLAYKKRGQMPVYGNEATLAVLSNRFSYCFKKPEGSPYPPIVRAMPPISPYVPFEIVKGDNKVSVMPLDQDHGTIRSLGFRIGDFAYCNDVVELPEQTLSSLEGVKMFIVDALRYDPHPTHAHLEKSLGWIEQIKPDVAVLTNLHIDLDYEVLSSEVPENVQVGFDGLSLTLDM